MKKQYRIFALCIYGLFLAAEIFVDLFMAEEPTYWKYIRALLIILAGIIAIGNLIIARSKNRASTQL
jgi:hypothetical protein